MSLRSRTWPAIGNIIGLLGASPSLSVPSASQAPRLQLQLKLQLQACQCNRRQAAGTSLVSCSGPLVVALAKCHLCPFAAISPTQQTHENIFVTGLTEPGVIILASSGRSFLAFSLQSINAELRSTQADSFYFLEPPSRSLPFPPILKSGHPRPSLPAGFFCFFEAQLLKHRASVFEKIHFRTM